MKVYTYDYLEKNGRLGNQLWQIAATIGEAERGGGIARFRPDWEYRDIFSVPDEYFEPVPDGAEVIDGGTAYFQEFHYFANVEDKIREYFLPSWHAADIMGGVWADFPASKDDYTFVAMHVRRGDYLKHPKHFPIMSSHYFSSAVDHVAEHTDHPLFIVFSDDPDWCRDNKDYLGIEGYANCIIEGVVRPVEVVDRVDPPQDWVDMFMIASCTEHIISNSTFSWWGAFLSGNRFPIYPSRWFNSAVPGYERWELGMPDTWRKFRC